MGVRLRSYRTASNLDGVDLLFCGWIGSNGFCAEICGGYRNQRTRSFSNRTLPNWSGRSGGFFQRDPRYRFVDGAGGTGFCQRIAGLRSGPRRDADAPRYCLDDDPLGLESLVRNFRLARFPRRRPLALVRNRLARGKSTSEPAGTADHSPDIRKSDSPAPALRNKSSVANNCRQRVRLGIDFGLWLSGLRVLRLLQLVLFLCREGARTRSDARGCMDVSAVFCDGSIVAHRRLVF